jgi:type I restriction enzyme R subunit
MTLPEQRARQNIDRLLEAAGWILQDRDEINLGAGRGVAVREFSLKTGFADYLLFVGRKAIGAVEAKAAGTPLSGVESQSEKYSVGLPDVPPAWRKPLPFLYESTGIETYFTNGLDPDPRSRRIFAFHQPETLLSWVNDSDTLRGRLQKMPPIVITDLWQAQIEAIENLEQSLAQNKPRALIQMATGSGKTFTAVNSIYRLVKFANARRVLFLVDRGNLGRQTLREFQQFVTPDDGRKFTELYNVQHLNSNSLDPHNRVYITTIQRLYSILSGEPEMPEENEEQSLFEIGDVLDKQQPKTVQYNPKIPIEYFDFIITDECHRSIYNLWRQVLEYFDAFLTGLTATPAKQTFGFFNQNLVMEYTRQRAVADGVNVDGRVFRIRTAITEHGSVVEAKEWVDKRDRQTRALRWEQLDDELTYDPRQLDRDVVAESQIRTVIRTFRDKLFTELFPGRAEVPKTLIFAKDDSHAEDIVRIVREEFGKGNDFCQKITYKVSGKKPEELIRDFRIDYFPRIAVTVDMIATGTDIKPLEVLLFMRTVKSRVLFEQMLGRGTRVISPSDLKAVTSDAEAKTGFIIVDAVGVVEQPKFDTQSLERQPSVPFTKLLQAVSQGARDVDTLETLAGRLAKLNRTLSAEEREQIKAESNGLNLHELANALLDAVDPDKHIEAAQTETSATPTPEQIEQTAEKLIDKAVLPFDNPKLRKLLDELQKRSEQTIDKVSQDQVLEAGFSITDTERARSMVNSFRQYIEEHKDEIAALQILLNQPYGQRRVTYRQVKELADQLKQPPNNWTPESLWKAFSQVEKGKVRSTSAKRALTDLVALVRHAVQPDEEELVPYPEQVQVRYREWLAAQEAAGRSFSAEQRWWLDRVAEHVGVNLTISPDDFDYGEFFNKGGRIAATRNFDSNLVTLLEELNTALVA